MVRLKDKRVDEINLSMPFQFQYGAIEGVKHGKEGTTELKFQFQYGAIEGLSM